jgi:hypothetical protein
LNPFLMRWIHSLPKCMKRSSDSEQCGLHCNKWFEFAINFQGHQTIHNHKWRFWNILVAYAKMCVAQNHREISTVYVDLTIKVLTLNQNFGVCSTLPFYLYLVVENIYTIRNAFSS